MKIIKNQTIKEIEGNTKYIGCVVLLNDPKVHFRDQIVFFINCSFRSDIEVTEYSTIQFANCNFVRLNLFNDRSRYEKCYIHELQAVSLEDLKRFTDCHIYKITTQKVKDDDLQYLERINGLISLKLQFDEWNCDEDVYLSKFHLECKPKVFSGNGLKYLQKFATLQELYLLRTCLETKSFHHITKLINLQKLYLGAFKERLSLRGLGNLQQLKCLEVENIYEERDYKLQDEEIMNIGELSNLIYLNLGDTDGTVKGIQALSQLKNLQYLSIGVKEFENGLEYIPKSVKHLKLRTENINIRAIGEFANLETLHLEIDEFSSPDYQNLEKLNQLQKFRLYSQALYPESLQISKMENLTHLNLSKTQLVDFIDFSKLPNLTHLDLSETNIDDSYLWYISEIKTLTHLNLKETQIKGHAFKYLKNLPSLTHLDLSDTSEFENLEGLSSLPSLTHLNLLNTFIAHNNRHVSIDIKFLLHLPQLKSLILNDIIATTNKIKKLNSDFNKEDFKLEKILPNCKIEEGYDQDYSGIFKWPTVPIMRSARSIHRSFPQNE